MMKTERLKMKLLIGLLPVLITGISQAQTWSHGSNELRTGIPLGGLGGASAANGSLLFYNSSNTNTVSFQSGTTSTSYIMTLPTAQGAAGEVLQNNGLGNLSWTSVSGIANVYEAVLTLSSADILALNTTPQIIVSSPGVGKYIEVISASAYISFNTSIYTINNTLEIRCVGADKPQCGNYNLLSSTITKGTIFVKSNYGTASTDTQIIENVGLEVRVQPGIGSPSGGDSAIKIKVMYRIVTI